MRHRPSYIRRWRYRLLFADPHCWYCGAPLTPLTATIDHVVPKSRGGTHHPQNLRLACRFCNIAKGSCTLASLTVCRFRGFGVIRRRAIQSHGDARLTQTD